MRSNIARRTTSGKQLAQLEAKLATLLKAIYGIRSPARVFCRLCVASSDSIKCHLSLDPIASRRQVVTGVHLHPFATSVQIS